MRLKQIFSQKDEVRSKIVMSSPVKPHPTSGFLDSISSQGNDSVETNVLDLLPVFSPGPLDLYRKDASFDYKKMALFLDGEDILRYKV